MDRTWENDPPETVSEKPSDLFTRRPTETLSPDAAIQLRLMELHTLANLTSKRTADEMMNRLDPVLMDGPNRSWLTWEQAKVIGLAWLPLLGAVAWWAWKGWG